MLDLTLMDWRDSHKVKVEPEHTGWGRLSSMIRDYDEARIKDIKEDIDTLLVFVSKLQLN